MRLSDARAICHQLQVAEHDPQADASALSHMAHWLERYTPSIQIYGSDMVLLDITGCAHLLGGEVPLLLDIQQRLAKIGYTARLGLADTIGAAFALARYGENIINLIAPEKLHQGLAFLPVRALRLTQEQADSLYSLGLKTIGQLFDIPRASLAKRFTGKSSANARHNMSVLARLDQALGRHHEPLQPHRPPPALCLTCMPPEPCLHYEGIKAIFDILLADLLRQLERRNQGLRKLTFRYFYSDGEHQHLSVSFARTCRVKKHIDLLFNDQLRAIDAKFGLDGFVMSADQIDDLQAQQSDLLAPHNQQSDKLSRLIDRLINRFGKDAIFQVQNNASHLPEKAQSRRPILREPMAILHPSSHRPVTIFAQPESIEVIAEIPEGPPMRFRWRRVLRQVTRARGPERIAPEWWFNHTGEQRIRDYYEVEDSTGQRYWLFRSGLYNDPHAHTAPHWRIHGLFL